MRKLIIRILKFLDGYPTAPKNHRQRGQSVIELALITPLLIMLVVGITEIGWYANNLLILQEVTRVGARRGAALSGDMSPLLWNNQASFPYRTDASRNRDDDNDVVYKRGYAWIDVWMENWVIRNATSLGIDPNDNAQVQDQLVQMANTPRRWRDGACEGLASAQGFYNLVVCTMLDSMIPLELKTEGVRRFEQAPPEMPKAEADKLRRPEIDDIVVSVFALSVINNDNRTPYGPGGAQEDASIFKRTYNFENEPSPTVATDDLPPLGWQVIVTGRYPTNANECTVDADGNFVEVERDPFDFIKNNQQDATPAEWNNPTQTMLELSGFDGFNIVAPLEYHRGFSWRGHHKVQEPPYNTMQCYGSEFSVEDIEELMRLDEFGLTNEQKKYLPDQGLVLVEIFWRHDMLLQIPISTTVFNVFGSDSNDIFISTWAAFPVLAAEPNIVFGQLADD